MGVFGILTALMSEISKLAETSTKLKKLADDLKEDMEFFKLKAKSNWFCFSAKKTPIYVNIALGLRLICVLTVFKIADSYFSFGEVTYVFWWIVKNGSFRESYRF